MRSPPGPAGLFREIPLYGAPAYALGALDPDELLEFRRALRRSPSLRTEVETFAAVTAALALLALPVLPDSTVKQALMAAI